MNNIAKLANYTFRHPRPSKQRIEVCKLRQVYMNVTFQINEDEPVREGTIRLPTSLVNPKTATELIKRQIMWLVRNRYNPDCWTRNAELVQADRVPISFLNKIIIHDVQNVKAKVIPFPVH